MADTVIVYGLYIALTAKHFLLSIQCRSKSMTLKQQPLGCVGFYLPFKGQASRQNFGACSERSESYEDISGVTACVSACIGG